MPLLSAVHTFLPELKCVRPALQVSEAPFTCRFDNNADAVPLRVLTARARVEH